MNILEELEERPICGDGAMGTLLMERGVPAERCFEELCVSDPDAIIRIHEAYLAAGARLIETNTFGANAVRLARHGLEGRVNEINWQAVQIAKQCARGKTAYVAGSIGPLGISAEDAREQGIDRAACFREQMGALLDGGVNLIFLETFQNLEELLLALHVKQSLHHCPAICSLAANDNGRLPDGSTLTEAFAALARNDAEIVGINCVNGPQSTLRLVERHARPDPPLAAFPNAGRPRYHEGRYVYETSPEYFAGTGALMADRGARIIGGCCGTTPAHIAALAEALREKTATPVTVFVAETPPPPPPVSAPREPNLLDGIAEGLTVIVTELDPPKTLAIDRYLAAAGALAAAGSDAITLADNSLAILRVSNLAMGAMLKERGITPLLHLSCRDRNVLGLQSDLLGMAALGIRHVLPLTGDPAKVGDHPGASSVYDCTSVQLIETIRRMNEGFTQSGTDLKKSPDFVIGCTFNPNAKNLDAQTARLERKVAAGAQYVMTQPVFDPALVAETHRRTRHLGIPVFIGVWPLLNGRQARFLHNEVPGIRIPDAVLARMEGKEGPEGRREGVEIARDLAKAVLDAAPCIYLITPFLAYETTAELAAFVRGQ